MTAARTRYVLGFYSGQETYAHEASDALQQTGIENVLVNGDRTPAGDGFGWVAEFAALRLPHEVLLLAQLDERDVTTAVSIIRGCGEPGVFVVHPLQETGGECDGTQVTGGVYSWRNILDRLNACEATVQSGRTDIIEALG